MSIYEVEVRACVWITLKDSSRLAAKLWIPVMKAGCGDEKFPAVLGMIFEHECLVVHGECKVFSDIYMSTYALTY